MAKKNQKNYELRVETLHTRVFSGKWGLDSAIIDCHCSEGGSPCLIAKPAT